jgi:hypothetical protein
MKFVLRSCRAKEIQRRTRAFLYFLSEKSAESNIESSCAAAGGAVGGIILGYRGNQAQTHLLQQVNLTSGGLLTSWASGLISKPSASSLAFNLCLRPVHLRRD